MTTSRSFAVALIVLLAASVLVLVAYGATWAVVSVPVFAGESADAGREAALTGRDLAPLGGAMGWVGLAAIAALLATRTWGRRLTGLAVTLAGGCAGVLGLTFGLTEVVGDGGSFIEAAIGSTVMPDVVEVRPWWLLAVVAGLAMMASGASAVVWGAAWPRLGARYSRDTDVRGAGGSPLSAASAWDALDAGHDPTAGGAPLGAGSGQPGSMAPTEPRPSDGRGDADPSEEDR